MKVPADKQLEHSVEAAEKGAGGQDIHPTAILHADVVLGENVRIGPYAIIGAGVSIGDGTEVMNHVTVQGTTRIGRNNRIYPYAAIGLDPQDKKYEFGSKSELEIGDGNTFRENVTVHRGTTGGDGTTRVGNGNFILSYCHIGHDCVVRDQTIFANCATLGGFVTVHDRAYLGGFTAVHPLCRIGELAITGGHTMVAQDIPPFVNATGNRAKLYGINKIGMQRAGYSDEEMQNMAKAYKIFFRSKLSAGEALAKLDKRFSESPVVMKFAEFVKQSERGICR
ncbi:MAG: acyl-ACP--UDP-N-acetylglucosamine O-acyltransferase [SAR324 cluster bacterium]|nr:acyl-ACP--UDP-N-acetylglucosamine O-acyltransferase [SAR324 cluster bacterium]